MRQPKKVLVLYYSQTEKTKDVIDYIIDPLRDKDDISIEEVLIEPVNPFPFPWPKVYFFSIFPECVYEVPVEIKEPVFKENKYDLIVIGGQVWFLSLSIPLVSFFMHKKSKIINNTKVITILNCRKMWIHTQKRMEEFISLAGGTLVDKVLITAQGEQMQTLTATKDNLFKSNGDCDKKWEVSPTALKQLKQQGKDLLDALQSNKLSEEGVFTTKSTAFNNTDFDHPEMVARKKFLQIGGVIKRLSKSKSYFRYFLTIIFLFFFFIMVFIGLPLWPLVKRLKDKKKSGTAV